MPKAYFMIDDEFIPAAEVEWIGTGSCGCIFAWAAGSAGDEILIRTEEDAKRFCFGEYKTIRDYYDKHGATVKPVKSGLSFVLGCDHEVKYGLPDETPPLGYRWRSPDGYTGRKTNIMHLTPETLDEDNPRGTAALCGRKLDRLQRWYSDTYDTVPCSNCMRAKTGMLVTT